MKILSFLAAITFASVAHADGPTDKHGFNEAGEEIFIYQDGEITLPPRKDDPPGALGYGQYMWTVEVVKPGEKRFKAKEKYKNQVCDWGTYKNKDSYSCGSDKNSPMTGATFAFVKRLPNCGGTLMKCVSGCSSRTPQNLTIEPWECE